MENPEFQPFPARIRPFQLSIHDRPWDRCCDLRNSYGRSLKNWIWVVLILSPRFKSYNWCRFFYFWVHRKLELNFWSERVELIDWISMVIIKISSSSVFLDSKPIHNSFKVIFSLSSMEIFYFNFWKYWSVISYKRNSESLIHALYQW